jgi:hypothetical protein
MVMAQRPGTISLAATDFEQILSDFCAERQMQTQTEGANLLNQDTRKKLIKRNQGT